MSEMSAFMSAFGPKPPRWKYIEARQARMASARALGRHSRAQWSALLSVFGFYCLRCGRSMDGLTKDHVTPVSQGGCDCIWNVQPLCSWCNSAKGLASDDYRAGWLRDWARVLTAELGEVS